MQSILPTRAQNIDNAVIISANERLKALCDRKNAFVRYLDLYDAFLADDGKLGPNFTEDGIHLTKNALFPLEKTHRQPDVSRGRGLLQDHPPRSGKTHRQPDATGAPFMTDTPPCVIAGKETILATDQARVTLMTLAPGQAIPLHRHSQVTDTTFCLEGQVAVRFPVSPARP